MTPTNIKSTKFEFINNVIDKTLNDASILKQLFLVRKSLGGEEKNYNFVCVFSQKLIKDILENASDPRFAAFHEKLKLAELNNFDIVGNCLDLEIIQSEKLHYNQILLIKYSCNLNDFTTHTSYINLDVK